jgi:hypothetical protein
LRSLITGKLTQLIVFPMKKREYHFTSTVDVPVGSPGAAAAIAKTLAPEEEPMPASLQALQEVRDKERRHREKKTRRERKEKEQEEKIAMAEPTPGADASPAPVEAQPHAHKSRREKKEKKERHHRRHKHNEADGPATTPVAGGTQAAVDPSTVLLSVLEAKVSATDREIRTAACTGALPAVTAKCTAALNDVKSQLLTTAFVEGDSAFRASLLSDRIDVLLARVEQQHTPPIAIAPPKAASDRRASTSSESQPRSWNEPRMAKHGGSYLAPFGSHRSSSSGLTTSLPTSAPP